MKKIALCFLVIFCIFSIVACGNDNVSEQDYDKQVTQETVDDEQESQEPEERGKDTQSTDNSKQETSEKNNESKITMEIVLLKNGETTKTDKISDNDKVTYFYDTLNALKYEVTDDVSFRDGVSVYFYDESNNMLQSFQIYEKYLKLNSLPDTYKISNTDFDYAKFYDEIDKNTLK